MSKKKTWVEKLNQNEGLPKVEEISGNMTQKWGNGTVVIPHPLEVNEIMARVPKGKVITITEIRDFLAKKHQTTIACPLTTGIFTWIAANAANEQNESGEEDTIPFWRTLKSGGLLNEKYPGGIDYQKMKLEEEGLEVVQKGKKFKVKDYNSYLAFK